MKKILYIVFGNALIAFAIVALVLNKQIVVGGVSGAGAVLNHYFDLPISLWVSIINTLLFLLGLVCINKAFALKTLVSTFCFPVLLQFFSSADWLGGLISNRLVAALSAGCLIGAGLGIILKCGASTGGIDIIGVVVNKKFGLSLRGCLNILDVSILLLQVSFHNIAEILLGLATISVTYWMMNMVLTANNSLQMKLQ